jgi:hypothetical protein
MIDLAPIIHPKIVLKNTCTKSLTTVRPRLRLVILVCPHLQTAKIIPSQRLRLLRGLLMMRMRKSLDCFAHPWQSITLNQAHHVDVLPDPTPHHSRLRFQSHNYGTPFVYSTTCVKKHSATNFCDTSHVPVALAHYSPQPKKSPD